MRVLTIACAVLVLVSFVAFGQQKLPDEASAAETAAAVPAPIPAAAKAKKNPVKPDDPSLERGRNLFVSQCAMCHGQAGRGGGDLANALKMQVPDFTDPEQQKKRTDGEMFYIITEGHGRMPADGERFEETWRWDLVNAIRTMRREK
jgi:high-affinity iron transporter